MSPTADDTVLDEAGTANNAINQADPAAQQTSGPTAEELRASAFEDSDHDGSPFGEHIMQRLRYFENLAEHQFDHIATLSAMLSRSGAAVPAMPHFPSLKSPIGDFHPHDRG